MAAKVMAYRIPCDEEVPVERIHLEDSVSGLTSAVFDGTGIEHEDRVISISTFPHAGVQMAYDDNGLYRAGPCTNQRAMRAWAHLTGRSVEDFVTPLVGNFVVFGVEPYTGETADVPIEVAAWIEEAI